MRAIGRRLVLGRAFHAGADILAAGQMAVFCSVDESCDRAALHERSAAGGGGGRARTGGGAASGGAGTAEREGAVTSRGARAFQILAAAQWGGRLRASQSERALVYKYGISPSLLHSFLPHC